MPFTVYYLDDEIDLCEIFSAFVETLNIDAKTFTDAKEAIDYVAHTPPDLFFIDYRLADTTGFEVADTVSQDIKKILVTGDLVVPDKNNFVDVINKPFRLKTIVSTIQKHRGI